MNSIQLLIQKICEEEHIHFQLLSKDWIIVLEKDGETHYIMGSKFDLNNYVSAKICNDKYACYEALKYHHIPVCEYHIFFSCYSKEEVMNCFLEYGRDVVVKANKGSYGNHMFHVKDINELFQKMDLLLKDNYSISVSPFYSISCEYRLIVLNHEVELVFGKKRPIVVGDGVHTIYELLLEFNSPFFQKMEDHSSLDVILKEGKVYEYSWQHNLSKGAIPFEVNDEELIEKLKKIAIQATNSLNLNFVSVDIIETATHELKIIEINSGVITNIAEYFVNGEDIAKNVYKKAILAMFEK